MTVTTVDAYAHRLAIGQRFGARLAAGDAVFLTGCNRATGLPSTQYQGALRPFSGVNLFMLLQVMKDQSWSDPRFFTAAQIAEGGWSLHADAKPIGLQFLVATGEDGSPSAVPQTKRFAVFNAAQIDGPKAMDSVVTPKLEDLAQAAREAGFPCTPLELVQSLCKWLESYEQLEPYRKVAGAGELRVSLAATLVQAQTGLHGLPVAHGSCANDWLMAIEKEPLSFFYAVKDSEVMAANVMRQVHSMRIHREGEEALAASLRSGVQAGAQASGKGNMGRNAKASPRVEGLFESRVAVLAVPFADKDRAQGLGAVWYPPQSLWFVPVGVDVGRFKEWSLGSAHCLGAQASAVQVEDKFRQELESLGFDISKAEVVGDGKWRNVPVNSTSKKNKAGSYVLRLGGSRDGSPEGVIRNQHTGQTVHWKFDGPMLTPEQRARMHVQARAREAQAMLDMKKAQDLAAEHAMEIWEAGRPANDHGYVLKKEISSEGLRQVPGRLLLHYEEFRSEGGTSVIRAEEQYLLIPMSDRAGALRAVQAIDHSGAVKSFMRGAQKKGTMLVLGGQSFDALCHRQDVVAVAFAEGIATGAAFREATGAPVVVCFDAGNLEAVAINAIPALPLGKEAVLAVDNDQFHVERAVGLLSRELGINPLGSNGGQTAVWDGMQERRVSLGDCQADGQWHETAKGQYCMRLEHEPGGASVRTVVVELVTAGSGRKTTGTFANRGVEAGRKVLDVLAPHVTATPIALAVPVFRSIKDKPTDWNDLVVREGCGTARALLAGKGIASLVARHQPAQSLRNVEPLRHPVSLSR